MKRSDFLKYAGIASLIPLIPLGIFKPEKQPVLVEVRDDKGELVESWRQADTSVFIHQFGLEADKDYYIRIVMEGQ